jgi:hypothetical protein
VVARLNAAGAVDTSVAVAASQLAGSKLEVLTPDLVLSVSTADCSHDYHGVNLPEVDIMMALALGLPGVK